MALRLDESKLKELEARGFKVEARIGGQLDLQGPQAGGVGKVTLETFAAPQAAPGHKYHAQADERQGQKFPSKMEARYFGHLNTLKAGKALLFFLRQVPFHVPGGRYVVDFVEFWPGGLITWTDIKGFSTESFKFKRRAVEAVYPIKIRTCRMTKKGPEYEER